MELWSKHPQRPLNTLKKLKFSLTETCQKVWSYTPSQLNNQAELYNKKMHGKPHASSRSTGAFHQVPKDINPRICTDHGKALCCHQVHAYLMWYTLIQSTRHKQQSLVVHFNCLKPYNITQQSYMPVWKKGAVEHMQGAENPLIRTRPHTSWHWPVHWLRDIV